MDQSPSSAHLLEKVNIIRDVFSYTQRFKGSLFVLKIEDTLMEHPFFPLLIKDIVQLQAVGIRIVLVPGTRTLIDKTLLQFGQKSVFHKGIRLTTDKALPLIQLAAMEISQNLLALLTANGAKGILGNWVKARSLGVIEGIDYQRTGKVSKIRSDIILQLVQDGFIPIIPNIGWNEIGRVYNVNSNEIALRFCKDLEVRKLFIIGLEEGVKIQGLNLPKYVSANENGIISNLDIREAKEILELNPQMPFSMTDFLSKSIEALQSGVQRVHLISGLNEGSILQEVFSTYGEGTMIYSNRYYHIRPVRVSDIPQLLHFMDEFVRAEFLISRNEEEITNQLDDYVLYEIDQNIQGCAALHDRGEGVAELAAVAVNPNTQSSGIGKDLVETQINRAKMKQFSLIYVLTTQAEDWFLSLGFEPGHLSMLSSQAKEKYNSNRNSKVLIMKL
jgi:amino-acid N-acetyltransferase